MVVFSAHRRSTSFMTSKLDPSLKNQGTLDDNDIEEVAQPTRRSALATVGAALAGAVFGAAVLTPSEAAACNRRTNRTDSDPSDGVGRGRTGLTDSDAGGAADSPNCGRRGAGGGRRRRTCTDQDSGAGSDPANHPC
jgi:hypothetical protein